MKDTYTTKNQVKKIEELHYELLVWKSNLLFIEDEIIFINHLLNSYVFQPNTRNLFERLQDYLQRIVKTINTKKDLKTRISKYENKLGGMMECTDESCDLKYYQKHNILKAEVIDFMERFKELKSEIFNYAGGILKKRKTS